MNTTYCPLKLMTARVRADSGRLNLFGGFNAADKCDEALCGFWSVGSNMCGIAAFGRGNIPQPALPAEEVEDGTILQPEVRA